MKNLLLIGMFIMSPALANDGIVSFADYEADVKRMAQYARECRESELPYPEGCQSFESNIDEHETLTYLFTKRMQLLGIRAFDGADNERLNEHMNTQERLQRDIEFVTEHKLVN